MNTKHLVAKRTVAAAIALSAAFGMAACSTDSGSDTAAASSSSTSSTVTNPEPAAVVPAVSGGDTSVALDQGFLDALAGLGVTPGVTGTATLADGAVDFPITGGTVTLYDKDSGYRPFVQGVLFHQGSGLSLTAGATTVELSNFTIDPGKPARLFGDVSVNGELAVPSAPLFDLNGTTLEPVSMDAEGNAVLSGTTVELSAEAADLLNTTFGVTAIPANLVIGIATLTVATS
ncbi:hypothetical protein [Modestobacter sp. Leaf380]|uniref:hypothetical protein n=1 Tax=Modestobacter sp. Leaf380 TaxID=1736356 RepID=UPI0012F721E4|nr:hypothetical protein [Modestobacter sp. Leaf380]